jgi:peptidoglycan biosynthesis protein MviN/MurJ (putative lipid II flippase)
MINILLKSMGPMNVETMFSLLFLNDKFSERDITSTKKIISIFASGILNIVIPSKTGKA